MSVIQNEMVLWNSLTILVTRSDLNILVGIGIKITETINITCTQIEQRKLITNTR